MLSGEIRLRLLIVAIVVLVSGVTLAINPTWPVDRGVVVAVAGRQGQRGTGVSCRRQRVSYSGAFDLISKQQRGRCARSQHS